MCWTDIVLVLWLHFGKLKAYTPNGSDQLRRTKVACILLALFVNWVLLVRVLTSGLTVWMPVLCCRSHCHRYTTIALLMYQSWYGFVLAEKSCLTGVKIRLDDYIFFENMLPSSTTSASWQVLCPYGSHHCSPALKGCQIENVCYAHCHCTVMIFAGLVWKCGQITESEQEAIMHAIDMKLLSMRVQYPASTCILFSGWRVMRLDNVWVF